MFEKYVRPKNYYEIRKYGEAVGRTVEEYRGRYINLLKENIFPCVDPLIAKKLIKRYHFLSHMYGSPAGLPKLDLYIGVINPKKDEDEINRILTDNGLPNLPDDLNKTWGNERDTLRSLDNHQNIAKIVRLLIESGHTPHEEMDRIAAIIRQFNKKITVGPRDQDYLPQHSELSKLTNAIATLYNKGEPKTNTETYNQIVHYLLNAAGVWDDISFLNRYPDLKQICVENIHPLDTQQ